MKTLTPATTSPADDLPDAVAPEVVDEPSPKTFEEAFQAIADRAQKPIDALSTSYVWRVYEYEGGAVGAALLSVGDCLCAGAGDGTVYKATLANLSNSGIPLGIMCAAANGKYIPVAVAGIVPTSITGLGSGTGGELVRVDRTAGTPVRGELEGTNYFLGRAGTNGALTITIDRSPWNPNDLNPVWFEDDGSRVFSEDPSIEDGDMEAATFVPPWLSMTAGTFSKETVSPHGGSQVGRIAYNGTSSPAVRVLPYTVGRRYTGAVVYGRGDGGSGIPRFWASNEIVTGTNSTAWQSLTADNFTATSTNLRLNNIASASGYADFDDVNPGTCISISEIAPTFTSSAQGSFTQSTPTDEGWEDPVTSWISADGVSDHYEYDGSKSDFTFLHYSTIGSNYPVFTICFAVNVDLSVAGCLFSTGTLGGRGFTLDYLVSGAIVAAVYSSAGVLTSSVTVGSSLSTLTSHVVTCVSNGTILKIYIDGVLSSSASSYSGVPESGDCTGTPTMLTDGSSFTKGSVTRPFFTDSALSDTDREQLEAWYTEEYSI